MTPASIPVSIGLGAWGSGLLVSALSDPERRRRLEVDLEAARRSEAVRRFDALHRPKLLVALLAGAPAACGPARTGPEPANEPAEVRVVDGPLRAGALRRAGVRSDCEACSARTRQREASTR